jgi:Putative addiction module component
MAADARRLKPRHDILFRHRMGNPLNCNRPSTGYLMVDRNAQALADQLLALPSRDRARLAEILLASLEGNDPGAGAAWDEEIEQRALDLETGRAVGISGDAVFAEVERRLRA